MDSPLFRKDFFPFAFHLVLTLPTRRHLLTCPWKDIDFLAQQTKFQLHRDHFRAFIILWHIWMQLFTSCSQTNIFYKFSLNICVCLVPVQFKTYNFEILTHRDIGPWGNNLSQKWKFFCLLLFLPYFFFFNFFSTCVRYQLSHRDESQRNDSSIFKDSILKVAGLWGRAGR